MRGRDRGGAGAVRKATVRNGTVWGAVRPYAVRLAAAGAAGAVAELCGLGLIAAAAWLIARAAQGPELAALSLAIVAVRGFALAKGSLRYVERLAGHDAALRAMAELRGRVFDALAARPAAGRMGGRGAGRGVRDGDALTRMVSDVDAVQDLLLRCVLPWAGALVCAGAGVVVCALAVPQAAWVLAAGLVAAGLVLPWAAAVAGRRSAARVASGREALAVRALDALEGAADLAVFGAEDRFAARAGDAVAELERAERSAARVSALVAAAGVAVQGVTAAGVVWAALAAGADEVAAAVAALTALVAVEAVLPVAAAAQRFTEVRPSVRRVARVLATAAEPCPRGTARVPRGPLEVELRGVTVRYGDGRCGDGAVALDGVDLRVDRGARIAVVGASGAGKSTLLAAVAGQVPVASGTVLLGGRALAEYAPGEVGSAVRGLTQEAHVFAATVRENLLLARPDASEERLREAAGRARFTEVVEDLPDGWDTAVGAGGRGLSGGQRQRLLLARALLSGPPVLVLDEPAEALDPAMADALTRDLLESAGGATVLLVTHRLAVLDAADEVVVLDRGRVVQRGPHRELLAVPGPYRDLWESERLAA